MKHKKVTAIVKPTNACNLRCVNCYAESGEGEMMSTETLDNMITKLQGTYDQVEYVWHGGEPLKAGLDFYKNVVEIEKREIKPNQKIKNSIQTNAILLDQEFVDFFKENKFDISISIDGPQEFHDKTRIYGDGRGSFDDVMRAVDLMNQNGISPGAICVINKEHLGHMEEIYQFFVSNNIGVKLNPVFPDGRAKNNKESYITPKEYGKALTELFDRWFHETDLKSVSQFENFVEMTLYGQPIGCHFHQTCQDTFIGVDEKGDVYPCGRFTGNKEFRYGNINTDDIATILETNPKRAALANRRVEECEPCEYKPKCNSGCMQNAYTAHGDVNTKDPFCPAYKMLFNHAEQAVVAELEKAYNKAMNPGILGT